LRRLSDLRFAPVFAEITTDGLSLR